MNRALSPSTVLSLVIAEIVRSLGSLVLLIVILLTPEFFSKEEIENKKSVIDGIEYKIFTIEEAIAFLKQHPKRRVYKESLDIIEEEEIKKYLKNNINFI